MASLRNRGAVVRTFIIETVDRHPADIARVAAERFGCSRQATHKHLQQLCKEGILSAEGHTRSRVYRLAPLIAWQKQYRLAGLAEDRVWRADVAPALKGLPDNVMNIWHYGFTEMLNNAIDHSAGTFVTVEFAKTAGATKVSLFDDGVGIFKKIQAALNLADERHSVLELAKGKLTTDPAHHTGEGIFFSSRMFDEFLILSGGVFFSHKFQEAEDWILQPQSSTKGTLVTMQLHNHTARTVRKVFDAFTSGEDYGFTKTVIPVELTRYGDDNLVSRSQAKRLLARFDRFKVVVLDFTGVTAIGQAFADEVFRVFHAKHPQVQLIPCHTNPEVTHMIARAKGARSAS
ncbi:ArsR family transcriptional regulator [Acidiferrobacter sp. SPIII_3]|jgi:anti-sigma regulatory factor (Ser/Thr protein kinase)/biotin operon repressor|nr:ArsR family transcriptional regulator [Acidiferrobacter sp. SPIII_3]